MKFIYIFLFCGVGICKDALAQFVIEGVVLDTERSFLGVPGVQVTNVKTGESYQTDLDGKFKMVSDVRISNVSFTKSGSKTLTLKDAGQYNFLAVRISKKNALLDKSRSVKGEQYREPVQPLIVKNEIPIPSEVNESVSPPTPNITYEIKNPNGVAIVIGNRDYLNGVPQVSFAINDCRAVSDLLRTGMGYKTVVTEENVKKDRLSEIFGNSITVGEISRMVNESTDLFIYYSGHGAPEVNTSSGFLLGIDANPSNVALTGMSLDILMANLSKLQVNSMVVVIDACFSGTLNSNGTLIASSSAIGPRVKPLQFVPKNGVIVTAGSGSEIASWFESEKHGILTYVFLQGIRSAADRSGDGNITAAELRTYLSSNDVGVPAWAHKLHNRTQTPEVMASSDNFIVTSSHKGVREFESAMAAYRRMKNIEAFEKFNIAASKGNAEAQTMLGRMLLLGEGAPKDSLRATRNLNQAIVNGDPKANYTLSAMYRGRDEKKALELLSKALPAIRQEAEEGDWFWAARLGYIYLDGMAVDKSLPDAIKWFRIAAEKANCQAQFKMGEIYQWGQGVEASKEEAIRWYERAAECGMPGARQLADDLKKSPTK